MQLHFPVYQRGNSFVLHVRINGRQIKRSLRTLDPNLAKVRATQLLGQLITGNLAAEQPATNPWTAERVHGLTNSAPPQTRHSKTAEEFFALAVGNSMAEHRKQGPINHTQESTTLDHPQHKDHEMHLLSAVFAEYGLVKRLRLVTQNDYASYGKEMIEFWGNRDVRTLNESDISNLIMHLRKQAANDPRTIDNKTGYLRAVINFLIKHGRHPGPNPAAGKNLVSKREKRKAGTKPFAYNDLKVVFGGNEFKQYRHCRPEIYLIVMVGLVTGMRVSSVARLKAQDRACPEFCVNGADIKYRRDDLRTRW